VHRDLPTQNSCKTSVRHSPRVSGVGSCACSHPVLLVLQPYFRRDVTLNGSYSLFAASQAVSDASRGAKRDASAQTTGLSMTSTVVVLGGAAILVGLVIGAGV